MGLAPSARDASGGRVGRRTPRPVTALLLALTVALAALGLLLALAALVAAEAALAQGLLVRPA